MWRNGAGSFGSNISANNATISSGTIMNHLQSSAANPSGWTLKCTDLPQFDALQAQADLFRSDDKLHLRNLCNDSGRCAGLTAIHINNHKIYNAHNNSSNSNDNTGVLFQRRMILDYSRQRVLGETMELLFDLADAVGLTDRREAFHQGHSINSTTSAGNNSKKYGQPVLHFLLRKPNYDDPQQQQEDAGNEEDHTNNVNHGDEDNNYNLRNHTSFLNQQSQQIWAVRQQVRDFVERVHHGSYLSPQGLNFCNTLVICSGRGGYQSGPECVAQVLEATSHHHSNLNRRPRTLRFLSCCDPLQVTRVTRDLNPAETLVVLILFDLPNITAEGDETVFNARTIQNWIINHYHKIDKNKKFSDPEILAQHFCAIIGPDKFHKCQQQFGVRKENMFAVGDWVNPRFSLCSAAGLLPLSLQFSTALVDQVLEGAHDMDEHFFHSPLRDNIPIILGLLGLWNSTFLGHSSRVILPYSDALRLFPAHVQQVDMESNGKRVALDGTPLLHRSGEINISTAPYIHQQALLQLLHQGRVVPADFIGFMQSSSTATSTDFGNGNNDFESFSSSQPDAEYAHNTHDEFMSRFFAEPDALAYGKTLVDLIQEGTPEPLREHMVVAGNRPSSSLLLTQLDAFAIGQLLALYEHRTAVQGFLWGLNSFDQFGMELGRNLAKTVRAQLTASRKTGASVQGFNSSTSALLEQYLAHGKRQQQRQSKQDSNGENS